MGTGHSTITRNKRWKKALLILNRLFQDEKIQYLFQNLGQIINCSIHSIKRLMVEILKPSGMTMRLLLIS